MIENIKTRWSSYSDGTKVGIMIAAFFGLGILMFCVGYVLNIQTLDLMGRMSGIIGLCLAVYALVSHYSGNKED